MPKLNRLLTESDTFAAVMTGEPKPKVRTRRFTRREYYRMADLGFFERQNVELIEGEIIVMSPQKPTHSISTRRIRGILEAAFGPQYFALEHSPLAVAGSEPEPDVAIIKGQIGDFELCHPTTAELVVEISLSSYNYDRYRKAALYARGGIPEYWIVNLLQNQLEVLRFPKKKSRKEYIYSSIHVLTPGETVSPLRAPKAKIAVADLLPPMK